MSLAVEQDAMWPFGRRSKTSHVEQPYDGDPQRRSFENTMQYGWRDLGREQARDEALEALEHGSQSQLAPTFERPAG
jgi:hypothetical protein